MPRGSDGIALRDTLLVPQPSLSENDTQDLFNALIDATQCAQTSPHSSPGRVAGADAVRSLDSDATEGLEHTLHSALSLRSHPVTPQPTPPPEV
jgi:hypothetical protein